MITTTTNPEDFNRLKLLKSYNLSRVKESSYDDLTTLAAAICKVERAYISILEKDTAWFKSLYGISLIPEEIKLNSSLCRYVLSSQDHIIYVEDTRKDERFKDNPYVTASNPIIFYVGLALMDENNLTLGTLCVIDNKPNSLNQEQIANLKRIANQVVKQFKLRRNQYKLLQSEKRLEEQNEMLREFAHTVSHDMKMPLANMIMTSDLLKKKYLGKIDNQGNEYLNYIKESAFKLSDYIDTILTHYESDLIAANEREEFDLLEVIENITDLLSITGDVEFQLPEENIEMNCNRGALEQILINLIGNSLKYNDKDKVVIKINATEDESQYHIEVIDNGVGIPEDKVQEIFKLFSTLDTPDRNGNKGNGIGLSTVKKIINNLGGTIKVNSSPGIGTTFSFTILK